MHTTRVPEIAFECGWCFGVLGRTLRWTPEYAPAAPFACSPGGSPGWRVEVLPLRSAFPRIKGLFSPKLRSDSDRL